uniref:WD_REPEATS_REGION domain-containing protein n=1 Tax=Caenorhabditis tropicalis TaxID=1561998 RepID=A0A1I7TJT5_9PELO
MGLPENSQLHFSEWNHNSNFIACGGALGTLKVVKIGMDVRDPKPNASALIVNQSLEGHNATVLNATWNENNQKLTTSDTSGLIIVWGLFNDQWAEEMINNRNKSVVVGICWNVDGTKIAIAYADGNVIVGTLEGNRIWNKELEIQLASCEWAPDGDMLIFGTADGKVTVYDDTGSHYLDIQMQCLESEDLEQALAKKENQKEEIICMKYWSPTLKSKALMELQEKEEKEQEKEKVLTGTAVFTNFSTRPTPKDHIEPEKNPEPYQPVPADRPRFMVAYARGVMQLMRSLSDTEPVVVRLKNLKITGAKWSPNGAFIAISGHDLNTEDPRHSSVHFISAYGQVVGFFQHFETRITGICWEASGLRMAIAADGNLFIGHVRPEFKWGAIEDTIVYAYQKEEQYQYGIMFYDYKIDEKTIKTVSYFENLASFKEHCIIINRQDDAGTIQALQNGGVYRANLSDGVITSRYAVTAPIDSMKLNCDFTRLAVVKLVEQVPFNITIYEFVGDELQQIYNCEKKDVWDYQWDANDSHMLAFKDKHKMLICDCSSVLEQSAVYGNIFSFQNLVVTSVNIEKLLITPESPTKAVIQESMIKAKQDVLSLLNAMKLDEAIDYAEKNPHAELWNMIAQYSVFKHQFDRAEHAFVKLEDYAGVQLVKRIRNIPSNELRNAEIFAFREQFEDAKDIFLHSDRKDLAIEMYEKVGDHRAVYELVKNDPDEERKKEAFKEMAEFHYENMDWEEAAKFFALCEDIKMQIDSLIRGNCFGELEVLARALPDESDYMVTMGDAFTTRGMCDQAVECYLKKKLPDRALHCCMELNQWQKAQFIADANHMENVEGLLGKYAEETTGASDEKSVATLGLYMRAGRHLDAAKIAFDIANDRREKMMPIDDLKQCYVLGALLVEEHRQSIRELKRIDKYNMVENTLDDESGLTAEQTRILENTWKGAEAFHYMMLAQKHLLTNRIEDALQTCVILSDYEEYLDPAEIYKMIGGDMKKIENKDFLLALAAANVGQFGICSRAMMRLEVLDTLDEAEREEMKDLSFELFSQYV